MGRFDFEKEASYGYTKAETSGPRTGGGRVMMARSHVYSGMAAGAAVLPWSPVPADDAAAVAGWVAVSGGAALLPDLDHHNATLTRMWGPVSYGLHKVLTTLGRGHRGGTHDLLLAPVAFGLLAWAASLHTVTAAVLMVLVFGIGLRGLEYVLPGRLLERGGMNLAAAAAAAAAVTAWADWLGWLPWAVALGVAVHIAGDAITPSGIPVPFTWLTSRRRSLPGGPVTTNTRVERWLVAPALLAAAVMLLWLHIDPALALSDLSDWQDLTTTTKEDKCTETTAM